MRYPSLAAAAFGVLLAGPLQAAEPAPVPSTDPYNPLATPYEDYTELLALQLLDKPAVQAVAQETGKSWLAATPPADNSSLASFPNALRELAFSAAVGVIDQDPTRPKFLRGEVRAHELADLRIPGSLIAINNPDTIYRSAPLDGSSAYVVTGFRYPVEPVDNNFSVLDPTETTVANLAKPDLVTSADGSFTITVDTTPANGRPNHLQIPSGPSTLFVRDTLSDWSSQRPNILQIQRVSGPAKTPKPDLETLKQRVVAAIPKVLGSVEAVNKIIETPPVNTLPQPVIRTTGGFLATQANSLGHFVLADDEAYVLTLSLGGAQYMTFPVNDFWQVQPDFVHHTTSLNNAQALPNPDGTYTFVLSVTDPGVYNWIDPVGAHEVITQLRWQGLPATTPPGGGPSIVSQAVVKLADLKAALPSTTVFVTKAERQEQQDQRARSFAWRKATG